VSAEEKIIIIKSAVPDRIAAPDIFDNRMHILNAVSKGEWASATPRTAVIEGENIEAYAPESLREIEIFLIAGEPVQKKHYRMFLAVGNAVQHHMELASAAHYKHSRIFGLSKRITRRTVFEKIV
jgi:hypothetical protein